jgi:type IV secretory pathway VirB10-like protein
VSFLKSLLLSLSIEKSDNLVHTSYAINNYLYKGAIRMKKVLSLILLLLLALTACGTQEKEDAKVTPEENKTEQGTSADKNTETKKELTAEDEKFINLMKEKNYDAVIKDSLTLKTEEQKNYYYLASAFIKNNEVQSKSYVDAVTNKTDNNAAKVDYNVIVNYLNRAKYVPDELKAEVDELRKASEEKVEFYSAELEKESAE